MSESYIKNISENGVYPIAFQFGKSFSTFGTLQNSQTEILVKQQEIIKKIAENGDAIIVGRGADYILKDYNTINIFAFADLESKITRCKLKNKEENLTDKELIKKINQIDKGRKNFYSMISGAEWGEKENYDLLINTSKVEIKNIVPSIANYIESYFGGIK